jgi:hypothetical protein
MLREVLRNYAIKLEGTFCAAVLPAPNTNPEILYTGVSYRII